MTLAQIAVMNINEEQTHLHHCTAKIQPQKILDNYMITSDFKAIIISQRATTKILENFPRIQYDVVSASLFSSSLLQF